MKWTRTGGMAAFVAALAIALALSLGLWGSWTASAQNTFIVNAGTGAGDPEPCDTPNFASVTDIQTVVDDGTVEDGDTLVLCPGTYNAGAGGAIQVDKQLTIKGLDESNREDVVVQGSSDGFVIHTPGVTISHLTLEGPGADIGIRIPSGVDENLIEDVEVTNWAHGISIIDAEGNIVANSYIHTNIDLGINIHDGADNTIQNNEITDNTNNGIDIDSEDQLLVDGNTLSGNGLAQIEVVGRSVVNIVRNQIETGSDGIYIGNVPAEALIIIGGSADMANTFTGPFGAPDYYVKLHCSAQDTVDATYNWWGSAVRTDIANRIFNDEDDDGTECALPHDGSVVFHPWATGPAPTVTPSPTPTPEATGTPTPTPGATRPIDLSPQGWHTLAWSGPDATEPATALACLSTNFSIAYMYVGTTQDWLRYVPGNAALSNMPALNKYDSLFVLISAAGVSCDMPVDP